MASEEGKSQLRKLNYGVERINSIKCTPELPIEIIGQTLEILEQQMISDCYNY